MLDEKMKKTLVERAIAARSASYSPYSKFAVGAALLTGDGKIYTGANIENASYTPTVCAERVAIFTAIHDGARDISAIAIVGGAADAPVSSYCPPCGVCRQVLSEFARDGALILLYDGKEIREYTLADLLPLRFELS